MAAPLVVVFDRHAPRLSLYAERIQNKVPVQVVPVSTNAEAQAAIPLATLVVLSVTGSPEDEVLRKALRRLPRLPHVVVVDQVPYVDAVYAGLPVRAHFVRSQVRLPEVVATVVELARDSIV